MKVLVLDANDVFQSFDGWEVNLEESSPSTCLLNGHLVHQPIRSARQVLIQAYRKKADLVSFDDSSGRTPEQRQADVAVRMRAYYATTCANAPNRAP